MNGRVSWLLLVCACSSQPTLTPLVDLPSTESDAYPFTNLDRLELSIAQAGSEQDLALVSKAVGQELSLTNIPFGDDLVVHLTGLTGSSMVAYGRTCALNVRDTEAQPRLYFSRPGRWGNGPVLPSEAAQVQGVALNNLGVFLHEDGSIHVIDPSGESGAVIRTLEGRLTPRRLSNLSAFDSGVLVVGGIRDGAVLATAAFIAPNETTGASQVGILEGAAIADTQSVMLANGDLLLTGGWETAGDDLVSSDKAWLVRDPNAGQIRFTSVDNMLFARSGHALTRLGSDSYANVLITGGLDENESLVTNSELFRPRSYTFEPLPGQMVVPRYGHKAIAITGNLVVILGGFTLVEGIATPVSLVEVYDVALQEFSAIDELDARAGVTGGTVSALPEGGFLLVGGLDTNGRRVKTVVQVKVDNSFPGNIDISLSSELTMARAGHAAVPLCDGTILIAGGTSEPSMQTERFNPPVSGRR